MILGLDDPNTARVVAARFISRAGGEAAFFVGIWGKAAYEFDATPAQQALVMASLGIFSLIGSALAGVLIDRFDPRRVLIVSEILFVPATLALVLPDNIRDMTLNVAFAGLTTAAVMTAVASLPPFLTNEPARLQRINSAIEAGGSAAFVAGPALGGLIAHYWSLDWIFVLDALTSVVAVALVARVALRPGAIRTDRPAAFKEMREGFRFAWTSPPLRLYLGIFAALWLSFGAFGALEPLFYRDVLGTGPEALGWVNTVFGAGVVAGSVLLSRLPPRLVCARLAVLGAVASGVGAIIYTGTADLRVVVVGAIYWGVVLGVMFPLVRTLIQFATPDHLVGRVMGTTNVSSQIGELFPLAFVPALAAAFGIQPVLIGSGVCLIVAALLTYSQGARIDKLRTSDPAQIEPLAVADEPVSPNP
ncbi:MAG: MFS transporter [Actinomycetota bacterium]|jgi:MFS family permease|nr:MFS transporter [Actinomycetota bacterium]MDQ3218312.1 MFS transporter [Actinomycetota bacterium]